MAYIELQESVHISSRFWNERKTAVVKREIATGIQDFEKLRKNNGFYIDKTDLIREWWDGNDDVTLVTRPRRFGKTLNMSMLNCFFSNKYENRGELFEGLEIWKTDKYRQLQGTYPVIFMTFAGVKAITFESALIQIKKLLSGLFSGYPFLYTATCFTVEEMKSLCRIGDEMGDEDAALSLKLLSSLLEKYYGTKALILMDEYDTPLQEAWINGYWDELAAFIRIMFNNTFKTNPSMERAIMTGITRVSKESIFSDLNNLVVVTTSSNQYAACFGFTENEVFKALDDQGFTEKDKQDVKTWYDGFTFGNITDMYNPWSITNYLNEGKLDTYPSAVWSLLLASGYLTIVKAMSILEADALDKERMYTLTLTNKEVRRMFRLLIQDWFNQTGGLGNFAKALLAGDPETAEEYLNDIMLTSMSSFDGGKNLSVKLPENFYHGLVLGLLAENTGNYLVRSNRESGYGRYDVIMEPKKAEGRAVILEFKMLNPRRGEQSLEDTCRNALKQIEEKRYDAELLARSVPAECILKYGLGFEGMNCLIRKGS